MMRNTILFRDDFDGIDRVSNINWALPNPSPIEATFLGRTQFRLGTFRNTLPQIQDDLPKVVDGVARLRLDTLNPILLDPPENPITIDPNLIQPSFFGTDLILNQDFNLDTGLAFEARVRINAPITNPGPDDGTTQRGLVASLFSFFDEGLDDGTVPLGQNIDEIDFEFLTNDINNTEQSVSLPALLTNVFDDDPLGVGNPTSVEVPDLDLTAFNTFRIEWRPDSIQWLVNDEVILTRTDIVPDEDQTIHLNFWVPDEAFTQAFDASLQPVVKQEDDTNESLLARNQTFFYEVDFVQVEQLPPPPITLVVNTTLDQNDGTDTDGLSLRDAILIANADPDNDYIIELAGDEIYSLTLDGAGDNEALTGDLDIIDGSNITIRSTSSNSATIKAEVSDRVFHVLGNGCLHLENVVITGGVASGVAFIQDRGGGIRNDRGGILNLSHSTVTDNRTGGPLGNSFGGGIFNAGTATLIDTVVSNNSSQRGGGIFIENGSSATLSSSTITGNQAGRGGGIFNSISTLKLINSTVSNNSVTGHAGGIENRGSATLSNTTISGNSARGAGGGIRNGWQPPATLNVFNSTVTNNTANANNRAEPTNNAMPFDGGGIFNTNGSSVNLTNSIVANNFDAPDNAGPGNTYPDIYGEVEGNNHNLIGDLTGARGTIGTGSDIVNPDPGLTPLQDNGGPTLTHAPLPGSPAIDAGDNSLIPQDVNDLDDDEDVDESGPFDQRGVGFDRIFNGTVDIGSVEVVTFNIINGDDDENYLVGTSENDQINGLGNSDLLLGEEGDDELNGGPGYDGLVGGFGDDLLDGGADIDGLVGGSGADQFLLRAGDGNDIIFDYQDGTDQFLLDGLTFEQLGIRSAFFNSTTIISIEDTGESLATLIGDSNSIGSEDFVTL